MQQAVVIEGWSVFFGLVAGMVLQIFVEWGSAKLKARESLKAAVFELAFVRDHKIAQWEKLAADFRNAVNGDTPALLFQYFDFSKAPTTACYKLIYDGTAYAKMNQQTFEKFVGLISQLSTGAENWFTQQVAATRANFVKATAVANANFFDTKIAELKTAAQDVLKALGA